MKCPIKLKNSLTCVPWWNKRLSKLRVEVRKLLNQARNTCNIGDWERFHEAQCANKKVIVVTNRNTRWFKYDQDYLCVNKSKFVPVIFEPPCSWKRVCESIKAVSEASRLHIIRGNESNPRLGCLQLPSGD